MIKLYLIPVIVFITFASSAFAKTDLAIESKDITVSKPDAIENETIRVFARVYNFGNTDVYGFVSFMINDKELGSPQPISVKADSYDDVFVDWSVRAGSYDISAKIINTNYTDEDKENNGASVKEYYVDVDSDKDNIGDRKDEDDDNDGLSDENEKLAGTDPLKQDTDGDSVIDNVDVKPLDKNEWLDSDRDEIGDNADLDDDNDELSDKEEVSILGTNPQNADTDYDGLNDKQEIDLMLDPSKPDSDNDGVNDSEDKFPLDPAKAQASAIDAIKGIFNMDKLSLKWIGVGIVVLLLLIMFFRKKH